MNKYCPSCKKDKPLDLFRVNKLGKLGRDGWCKLCRKLDRIKFYANNPQEEIAHAAYRKLHNRRYELKRKYGATQADYEMMYATQKGICLLCNKFFSKLCIDHDHITGKIRGLLCSPCNIHLGHYEKIKVQAEIYLSKDIKRVSI